MDRLRLLHQKWAAEGVVPPAVETPEERAKKRREKLLLGAGIGATGLGLGLANAGHQMLSDTDETRLNGFLEKAKGWNQGVAPRKMLDEYVQSASNASQGRLFGVKPVDVMRVARSGPWMNLSALSEHKWKPDSGQHYEEFGRGPLSGYLQLTKELTEDPGQRYRFKNLSSAQNWQHHRQGDGKLTEVMNNVLNDGHGNSITPITPETLKDTKEVMGTGTGNPLPLPWTRPGNLDGFTSRNKELIGKFLQSKGVNTPLEQVDFATQQKLYPEYDKWLKWRHPIFHNQKQFVDYVNAGSRVPQAGKMYGGVFMRPLIGIKNVGIPLGIGLGTAGAGLLGWYGLNKFQEWRKKRDEEKQRAAAPVGTAAPVAA